MDCDLEMPVCYGEKVRKARKPHRCGDCKGDIKIGERYLYISGIWEDKPASFSRCMDCNHIRCMIRADTGSDQCMELNGLARWLEDCSTDDLWFKWAAAFNASAAHRGSTRQIDIAGRRAELTPSPTP